MAYVSVLHVAYPFPIQDAFPQYLYILGFTQTEISDNAVSNTVIQIAEI
jgi:hypothetical protein